MHCGPVRHKIPSETDLVQELHVHPTATTIREDIDSETPGILSRSSSRRWYRTGSAPHRSLMTLCAPSDAAVTAW